MNTLQLLMQIAAILLCGRLLARLLRPMGQPTVIAEIVAGILLGPSLLGLLWPAAMAALFPPSTLPVLGMASQLGLVFFMFLVGLEFDPSLLRGQGRASVAISNAGILVPFALGSALSVPLHSRLAPEGIGALPFGLFCGAAMSVTAFPVLARILTERRLIRTRVGTIALASAAVDDVSAWCLLAFVVAVAQASGIQAAALTTVLAIAYILLIWKVVRPVLARLASRGGQAPSTDTIAFVFLLLLFSASLTEWIGIHALFGAFVFGAAMPREGGLHAIIAEKLEDFVTIVLLPLFFAYSGLRTQVGLLSDSWSWGVTGVIIAVATLGKFGGTAVAARISGLDLRTSAAIGILMNTRGLMELLVLNIGLDLGVISPQLFTMLVIMALVTTAMTSPLLERLYPASLMAAEAAREPAQAQEPAPAALICVSDPGIAAPMVAIASAWTRKNRGAVWALYLRPTERPSEYLRDPEERAEDPLVVVSARAEEVGLNAAPISFSSAQPGLDILRVAALKQVPLVLIGVHRSVLRGETLGGETRIILEGARSDVGVVVDRGLRTLGSLGLLIQPGPSAAAARRVAERLAEQADLVVLPVEAGADTAGLDLVVAPFLPGSAVPEGGSCSWLLVAGPERV